LKFTPKLQKTRIPFNKKKLTDKITSFVKLPPLIPVKTHMKVIEIFKFFKKEIKPMEKRRLGNYILKHYYSKQAKFSRLKKCF